MRIIYNKYIPFTQHDAVNILGVVFARIEKKPISAKLQRHEAIHTAQMKELLYIFFYPCYGLEWIFRLIQYRDARKAYRNISFEREAYANASNENYLKERKRYSFVGYLNDI